MPIVTSKSSSVLSSGGMKTPALLINTCRGVPLSKNLLEKSFIELQYRQKLSVDHASR